MAERKRYSFWIGAEHAAGLKRVKETEMISESDQIRTALGEWLEKKGALKTAKRSTRKPRGKA